MPDRKESAADISISFGSPDDEEESDNDITVSRLQVTKDIDVEQLGGSGMLIPENYAVNQITYQGTMELHGNRLDLQDKFFDDNGRPVVTGPITITHYDDTTTDYQEILATSEGYEMNEGETTTTTYEFVAMGKSHGGKQDKNE